MAELITAVSQIQFTSTNNISTRWAANEKSQTKHECTSLLRYNVQYLTCLSCWRVWHQFNQVWMKYKINKKKLEIKENVTDECEIRGLRI